MKLSIIIPVYNEEKTIAELINKVKSVKIPDVSKEIIVVDDGSVDKSVNNIPVEGIILIKHEKNQGKGAAIKTGIAKNIHLLKGFKTRINTMTAFSRLKTSPRPGILPPLNG